MPGGGRVNEIAALAPEGRQNTATGEVNATNVSETRETETQAVIFA